MQPATARLNGSVGDSFDGVLGLTLEDIDILSVIPGRRAAASPESISPIRGYGFRARPYGPSRNDANLMPRSPSFPATPPRSSADRTRRQSGAPARRIC